MTTVGLVMVEDVTALIAAVLAGLQDNESAKRGLAEAVRPYLPSAQNAESGARLLNAREKATQVGLHPDTLRKMARDGRIWATKVGREWRFRADRSDIRPRAENHDAAGVGSRRRSDAPPSVAAIRGC